MATTEQPSSRRARWWSEPRRVYVATGVATATSFIATTAWVLFAQADRSWLVIMAVGGIVAWAMLVAMHAALTAWAFHGLRGDEFRRALEAARGQRAKPDVRPSWSMQISAMALVVVVLLVVIPQWREVPLLLVLGLTMVIAAWIDMALAYAVYYASIDRAGDRFVFEDDDERGFSDYVYVAFTIQTTFATSDVGIRTRELRSKVTAHNLVAFAFNTVTVGIIVALLMSSFTGSA